MSAASFSAKPNQARPDPADGREPRMQGVHPLPQSRLAALPPAAEVRRAMEAAIAEHSRRRAAWHEDRYSGEEERRAAATGHAPLLLLETTTGLGKTSMLLKAQAGTPLPTVHIADRKADADRATARYPVLFRRRAHEDAPGQTNHCARVAPSGGVLGYREDKSAIRMPDNWSNMFDGDLIIRKLARHWQSVGGNLCPSCPKGILSAIHNPTSRYTLYQKQRLQKFIDQHFSAEDQAGILESMCWLDENRMAMTSTHIAITLAGLGASDIEQHDITGGFNRGLNVDETRPGVMGDTLSLTFADIGTALDDINDHRIRAFTEKGDLMARLPSAKTEKGEDAMRARIEELTLEVAHSRYCEDVYKRLHAELLAAPESEWRDVPRGVEEAVADFRAVTKRMHIAPHEKASWNSLAELRRLPIRLMEIIAESIERGSASILPGRRLCVAVPSQLNKIIEAGDHPVAIADATPDQTMRDILGAKPGGVTLSLKAAQNVLWWHDHRRYRGTGPRRDRHGKPIGKTREMILAEARRKLREGEHTERRIKQERRKRGFTENTAPWAHIGNRQEMIPLLSVLSRVDMDDLEKMPEERLRELAREHRVGWYGLHDRAHDEWTGCNIQLWGDPSLPDAEAAMLYTTHRALRIHAGLPALPHYTDKWLAPREHCIEMSGNDVEVPRRVHAVPEIRDFIQTYKDNIELQATGRGRGTNSDETLLVAKHGGTPNAKLDENGIQAVPMILDPSPTDRERKAQEREDTFTRVDLAMTELVRDGKNVTRKNLNHLQREAGQPQTAPETYRQWLASPHAMPFAERMAKIGRGAVYARALRRGLARGREDITERDIESRVEEIRQAQISKGGVVTDEAVLHGMLFDALRLYESSELIDRLAAEVITTVFTGNGGVYHTEPPATAPPTAA